VSAVSTERVIPREVAPAAAVVKPIAPEAHSRRRAIERAATEPIDEAPARARDSGPFVEVKVDPTGATFFDEEAPKVEARVEPKAKVAEPAPRAEANALDRSSIEFPMASSRPKAAVAAKPESRASTPKVEPVPKAVEAATKVDDPQQTRENRGKPGKARKPAAASKPQNEPAISVAGPARLAAAFAPLEGPDNIEQGETHEAELGRAFRQAQEEERQAREARFARGGAEAALEASMKASAARGGKPVPVTGSQQAQGGKREAPKLSAAEVIALSQVQAIEEEKRERRSRIIGGLFLMMFCFFLARAVPLLTGSKEQAVQALGARTNIAAVAFAALSVVVLIRTWAMQIQTKAMLLKPVTYSLKVVVVCTAVLTATLFMPAGGLGMVAGAARRFLPWSSAAFFMFLGIYGMMRGIRETQANALAGIAMTLAYGGSFVGSYSIAHNVIMPGIRGQGGASAMHAMLNHDGTTSDPNALLEASGLDPEAAAEIKEHATAEDGFQEVHMVGGDEEEDMKSIREMGDARKRNSEKLKDLKEKLPELSQ